MFLPLVLLLLLFWASGVVWRDLIRNWQAGQPLLALQDSDRARWTSFPEQAVVVIALLWLTAGLSALFWREQPAAREIDAIALKLLLITHLGLALLLSMMLKLGARSWTRLGFRGRDLLDQIRIGEMGFLAAIIPMAVTMTLTIPLRPLEEQNPLLKLLQNSPDNTTILLVGLTAVLQAPVWEELLFRVILQGWLVTWMPPRVSITVVAVIFCLVHGWRDGLALLPLALILGYAFHRCHSYLAVVVIHALFNATMLVFQLLIPEAP